MAAPADHAPTAWIEDADCDLDDFRAQVARDTDLADYPLADDVRQDVLVYSAATLARAGPARTAGRADPRAGRRARRGRLRRTRSTPTSSTAPARRSPRSSRRSAPRAPRRATTSARPGANDRIWNAAQKLALHAPEVFADYYATDALALVCAGLARPALPGHLAGQRRQSRWRRAGSAPRLPPRLRRRRPTGGLSGARAPHVGGADAAGRGRALRHAARERADDAAAPLAAVRRRLHRVLPPRVHRLLRDAPRAGAAAQGRRGVLQPRAVSRRGIQHLGRHPPDGEPAADLVAVRSRDGGAGPHRDGARGLPGAARDEGRRPLASGS